MNGVTVPSAYAVRSSPDYVWGAGSAAIELPTVQWAIGEILDRTNQPLAVQMVLAC